MLLLLATGLLLVACRNNTDTDLKNHENTVSSANTVSDVVFNKPVLIFIKSDPNTFNPGSSAFKEFLFRAQELGIETAVMPAIDMEFIYKSNKRSTLRASSLTDGTMVLFNGSGLMITYPDEASMRTFNAFYEIPAENPKNHYATMSRKASHTATTEVSYSTPSPPVTNEFSHKSSLLKKAANIRPSVKDRQLSPVIVRNPFQQSYISTTRGLSIRFDNDLFSNTDRYYTNGVEITYRSPSFAFWRVNNILPVSTKESMEHNMLQLRHEMYTPFTTKVPPLLEGDRPYASALYLRFRRIAEKPGEGIIQDASFDIGVIGKAALGSVLQKGVHAGLPTNDEPLGWETQISNDVVMNYNYRLSRQLVSAGNFFSYSTISASVGTYNTSAETGIGFKIGTDRFFLSPLPDDFNELTHSSPSKWRFSLESDLTTRIVGHNATLTGGLLNKNNIYVLKPEEIERLIFTANARISLSYSSYGISIAQYYLSKEFNGGKSHFWGQIGINIGF